jgi:hypothetical protein
MTQDGWVETVIGPLVLIALAVYVLRFVAPGGDYGSWAIVGWVLYGLGAFVFYLGRLSGRRDVWRHVFYWKRTMERHWTEDDRRPYYSDLQHQRDEESKLGAPAHIDW